MNQPGDSGVFGLGLGITALGLLPLLVAAAFQLVVLACLLAVERASILLVTELVAATPPRD